MIWLTAFVLSLIPALLWWSIDPTLARFSSFEIALTSIGQIAGLMGLALFAFNIFLSARFKWFEKVFGPLNRIYVTHHLLGIVVWVLLITHPLTLLSTYGIKLLLPYYGNWPRNLGLASLLFFDALIILSLFIKLPYQIWRATHKFLGVVLIMGAIHAFFVPSDISLYPPLRVYMLTILFIAAITYLMRTVFGRKLISRQNYIVQTITTPHPEITQIELIPTGKQLKFAPGQFIFITFNYSTMSETHPFSLLSAPTEPHLSIAAKSLGDFTKSLAKLPLGTTALIEGPFGKFSYKFTNRTRLIWIAGGIGITPFISMAKSLPANQYQVDLYYSAKTVTDAAYLDSLTEICVTNPSLKLIPFFSDTSGRLTAKEIIHKSGTLEKADIYICGPKPMMKSLRKQFNDLGIRHSHIHTEEFSLY